MGLFDALMGPDINQGIEEWKKTPGAVLVDVRTPEEYRQGHVPGSVNVDLNVIQRIADKVPEKDTPLFVHCLSGARSRQAAAALQQMGYSSVKNIGGINRYKGNLEV